MALFVAAFLPADAAKIVTRTLPNGVTLIAAPDPALRLASLDVWVRAGAALEKPEEAGAAHFLEHVIFKGTPTRPAGKLDQEIESMGATLNAQTSRDWAHFYTTVAAEYLDTAIDVLSDALLNPAFKDNDVERERRVIQLEIASRRAEPMQVLDEAMAEALFGGHPYGRPVYGTVEQVKAMNAAKLRAFRDRCYTGAAMTVIVTGNVDPEDVLKKLAARFDRVPRGEAAAWPDAAAGPKSRTTVDLPRAGDGSEWLGICFLGPSIADPADVWATDMLVSCLVRRGAGIVHDRLVTRDKIALAADTSFLTQRLPSLIGLAVTPLSGKTDGCASAVLEEIGRIRTGGVPEAELEQARRFVLGTYAFDVETASGQASSLGFYSVISSVQDSVNYIASVRAVTAADVKRVAGKYLDPDRAVIVRMSK
jgi:predicted Zn-dependent peptidase